MTCRPIARVVIAACTLALVLPTAVAAQDQPPKASIVIAMSGTERGGTVFMHASGNDTLKVGETGTHYLYTAANGSSSGVGATEPPVSGTAGGMLVGGVSGGLVTSPSDRPPDRPRLQYDYLWQTTVKPVSIGIDVVTFELDWKRSELKDGTMQVTAGDHRTITLRQGEKHLLDFIATSADARYANVFLDLQASPVEDPAIVNLTLGYDLWLVHQTGEGAKITRHALVTGRQGEKVDFNFAPVPLQLDGATAPDADSPFRLVVNGTITGRVKPDGTIEVALQPTRREIFPTGGGGFGGGTKTFVSRADEATSIALPANQGFSGWQMEPGFRVASPKSGVTVTGDLIRVNEKAFFEGTTTSILVTVHRER